MNGLPSEIDLSMLNDKQIEQICFGAWVVIFNIEGRIRITIESAIVAMSNTGQTQKIDEFRNHSEVFCRCIGDYVQSAKRDIDGGLILHLRSGESLIILNNNDHYESFQLQIEDKIYVA